MPMWQPDTNTSASQFSYLALVSYVSYLVFEIPQGYLMQRFPTAKYLGPQVILWGLVLSQPESGQILKCIPRYA
jgi:hypothetical protein